MIVFILGLIVFFGSHSIRIVAEPWRQGMIARIGADRFKMIYSVVSIVGFALLVWGFSMIRYETEQLWTPPVWARHITITLMLISFVILGGFFFRKSHIAVALHHPMLIAIIIFAIGHLLANGSQADVWLFGAFLVWALADLWNAFRLDRRYGTVYPAGEMSATIANLVVGVALWALMAFFFHMWLFGVSPLSM